MRRREGPASQAALHHGSSSAQRPSGFLSIDQFRPDEEDKYPAWDVDVGGVEFVPSQLDLARLV